MGQNGSKLIKKNPFNFLVVLFIKFYRLFIARFFYGNCRFFPSCSEYSIEAFENYNFFSALKKSLIRLSKCHPYGSFGYDPINKEKKIKRVSLNYMKKLRLKELYNKKQAKNSSYSEDKNETTKHFVLFKKNKAISGLTLIKTLGENRFQIRGMFTVSGFRSRGYGSELLENVANEISDGIEFFEFWCNARITALKFYKKNNFKVVGKEFLIKDIGNHKKMVRKYGKKKRF